MKIAVLVKQTPQLSEVTMSGDGPKWPDGTTAVNPFDEYAVEEALRLKESSGGTAIAITYGSADAESVLRDVLALGIDEAYHIESDSDQYRLAMRCRTDTSRPDRWMPDPASQFESATRSPDPGPRQSPARSARHSLLHPLDSS